MTMKAFVYGGVQIVRMTSPSAHYTYDGIHIQFLGSTLTDDGWKQAGISFDMSAADAMDLVMVIIDAVQKHSEYDAKLIPNFANRLTKKMERKR